MVIMQYISVFFSGFILSRLLSPSFCNEADLDSQIAIPHDFGVQIVVV